MKKLILILIVFLFGCAEKTVVKKVDGCFVAQNEGGVDIYCDDGTSAFISDGIDGIPGTNGVSSIISIVDPCGRQTQFDEILIGFQGGTVVAWYEDRGLVVLEPNLVYETTDGTNCRFIVDVNGSISEL